MSEYQNYTLLEVDYSIPEKTALGLAKKQAPIGWEVYPVWDVPYGNNHVNIGEINRLGNRAGRDVHLFICIEPSTHSNSKE